MSNRSDQSGASEGNDAILRLMEIGYSSPANENASALLDFSRRHFAEKADTETDATWSRISAFIFDQAQEAVSKPMPTDKEYTDVKVEAVEARVDAKLARLENKIDVVIAKLDARAGDASSIKWNMWLALIAGIGIVIATLQYGDQMFSRGTSARDIARSVVQEMQAYQRPSTPQQ